MMQSSLPLSDRDPNTSGRNSRASHFSTGSKGAGRKAQQQSFNHGFLPNKARNTDDMLSAVPGVMGMLRTTMEIGDVASLAVPTNRFNNPGINSHHPQTYHPRGPTRLLGTSRFSTGSANSHSLDRSAQSRHRVWPSVSSAGRRRSITSNVTAPPFLEPPAPPSSNGSYTFVSNLDRPISSPGAHFVHSMNGSGRATSMTMSSTPLGSALSNYRSLSSLRGAPREAYPRPRSPFHYPTRLKRPGYRPISPALSDVTGSQPSRYLHVAGRKSRLPGGSGNGIALHPAPYPTHRNRSAPTVVTMLNMPTPRNGPHAVLRDDTPSLSDGSMNQAKAGSSHNYSFSIRSNRSIRSNMLPSTDIPSSSNPPTPTDFTHVNAVLTVRQDSKFVMDKGLKPTVAPVTYYDYTEDYDFEKEVTEVYNETMPDSPMPLGFLDRIRTILEDREKSGDGPLSPDSSAIVTPRNSIQDVDTPVTPIAELPATPVLRRITREMIIAALASSSDLLEPDSVTETITDMVATPPPITDSSAAAKNVDDSLQESTDDGDYHSVASRMQSSHSHHSQSLPPISNNDREPMTKNFSRKYQSAETSTYSLASFVADDLEEIVPTVPELSSCDESVPLPPVTTAGNESIIEKVKCHWSLRRSAVVGPTKPRQGSLSEPRTIPKRYSSSQVSLASKSSTVIPELDSIPIYHSQHGSAPAAKALTTDDTPEKTSIKPERELLQCREPAIPQVNPYIGYIREADTYTRASFERNEKTISPINSSHTQMMDAITSPATPLSFQDIIINQNPSRRKSASTGTKTSIMPSRRNQMMVRNSGMEFESNQPYIKEFGVDSLNIETRSSIIRTSGSKYLPEVKEEPGFESSADLRRSTFKFPSSNRLASVMGISERKRVISGVRGIVESIRYLKDHRVSSVSGNSKGQTQSCRPAKEHRLSTNNTAVKSPTESISSNEYRLSIANTSMNGPLETVRVKEHRPSTGSSIFKGLVGNGLTMMENYPSTSANSTKDSKEKINLQNQNHSNDSIPPHKVVDVPLKTGGTQSTVFKQPSNSLLDAHAIPSLNFSSINLLGRLNDALELRRASLGSEFADLIVTSGPSPKRHSASTVIREKYKSIFLSFDDLAKAAEHFPDFQDNLENVGLDRVDTSDAKRDTQFIESRISPLRPLSPHELIEEVQRISVPSVTGLTQRLSELLPSLRCHFGENGDSNGGSDPLESTINEIRELGKVDRRGNNQALELDENWEETVSDKALNVAECFTTWKRPDRPYSVPPPELAELPGTFCFPNAGRLRSISDSEIDWSLLERINRLARNSNRSLNPKTPLAKDDTCPWNHESNYPWSNSIPFFDVRLPIGLSTGSPRALVNTALGPSKLNSNLSDTSDIAETVESNASGVTGKLKSTLALKETNPEKFPLPAAITHRRHYRKSGLLGSISRRVFHGSGFPTGVALSETSTINASGHRTNHIEAPDHPVDPGDRYPTTGLSPPSALNLDDVHSFFSDDSNASTHQHNQRPRVGSFRKRLTSSLRARLPGVHQESIKSNRKASSNIGKHRGSNNASVDPHSEGLILVPESSTHPPVTMSCTEVKAKKLVDRLKSFLWRGGEILRTMSMRRQRQTADDEHCSETDESLRGPNMTEVMPGGEYDAGRTAMTRDIGSSQSA